VPAEIELQQGRDIYTFLERSVILRAADDYQVRVPVASVAPHLKSLIVEVQDVTDQRIRYAYLLRRSANGAFYEGVLPAAAVVGEARLTLTIYDFEAAVTGQYQLQVRFAFSESEPTTIGWLRLLWQFGQFGWLFLLAPVVWWAILRYERWRDVRINAPAHTA
jgi:hypothetical protein